MTFTEALAYLTDELIKSSIIVYHQNVESAERQLKASAFYGLLTDESTGWWKDSIEKNFERYQNEIEYGAWNRNERGGIVE